MNLTIQRLKKQVAEQRQQLEQIKAATLLFSDLRASLKVGDNVHAEVLAAIAAILDYSTRLGPNSAVAPEQLDTLKAIYQNGQSLLNLLKK